MGVVGVWLQRTSPLQRGETQMLRGLEEALDGHQLPRSDNQHELVSHENAPGHYIIPTQERVHRMSLLTFPLQFVQCAWAQKKTILITHF